MAFFFETRGRSCEERIGPNYWRMKRPSIPWNKETEKIEVELPLPERAPHTTMSTPRIFELTLTITIPNDDDIQVSVSSPRRVSAPRAAPSAPLKSLPPALVDDEEEEKEKEPHHSAARSLYTEFNQPIEPFDFWVKKTIHKRQPTLPTADPFDFSKELKPVQNKSDAKSDAKKKSDLAEKNRLILSLRGDMCLGGVPVETFRRLKDFLACVNFVKGHTTPEHVVELYEQYEGWVKKVPEEELCHLNRYQRMTRFLSTMELFVD